MRLSIVSKLLLSLSLVFVLPVKAEALPAISCHCFTDRSYEPTRPAAADPYFLATFQNSFFAIVFNTDRKSLIMQKQKGTSSDELWVAHWLASKSDKNPDNLLKLKMQNGSWKNVVESEKLSSKNIGARFSNLLNTHASSERLSAEIVDELLIKNRLLSEADLAVLRKAGATNQELIISTVISAKVGQPARLIYFDVKGGGKTWGALLTSAKIDTKNLQREISTLLRL